LGAVAFWGRFEAAYLVFVVGASVDWEVLVYGVVCQPRVTHQQPSLSP
jgi:hypothetical protein